ncbi:hypothetical protein [Eubacterium oxidoreducens]|uniref:Uncharacterized protein n=1 Tax=Eubacterium oxidoreducens TaxID=1732 RepID=A0A1G6BFH0_EUBOX|nr:hypothetical protein [Eubacterium oxidoreducens]SDB19370.1 hypothetical protein SAMN02910417_01445 [Eubacterium oxidoreducens]
MKLFSVFKRIFNRRKEKKEEQILADFLGMNPDDSQTFARMKLDMTPEQVEHYILDKCELIIDNARVLDEKKEEYYEVMDYLKDLQTIRHISVAELAEIKNTALHIHNLNKAKDEYVNRVRKITDNEFTQMKEVEEDIPQIVKRLQKNEAYQNTVKRDMAYLEGEKLQWTEKLERLSKEQKFLKGFSMFLFTCCFVLCAIFAYLQFAVDLSLKEPFLIAIVVFLFLGIFVFWKNTVDEKLKKEASVNLNYAISILNKVKIKYVNVTNAVDYTREKFHVESSYELSYRWEKYMESIREQENFEQTNEDLEYYQKKFESQLLVHRLKHFDSWKLKSEVFLNDNEFEALTHELLHREETLKEQMAYNSQVIERAKNEIQSLVERDQEYSPKMKQILDQIEKITS